MNKQYTAKSIDKNSIDKNNTQHIFSVKCISSVKITVNLMKST